MRLDRAFTNEDELARHVEKLLGATVTNLRVISVDLVNDTTLIDVRWVRDKHSQPLQTEPDRRTHPTKTIHLVSEATR